MWTSTLLYIVAMGGKQPADGIYVDMLGDLRCEDPERGIRAYGCVVFPQQPSDGGWWVVWQ